MKNIANHFGQFPMGIAVVLASFAISVSSTAASVTWTNVPAGGAWNATNNWSGAAEPGVGDLVFLTNQSAGYTVDYTQAMSAASISNLTVSTAAGQTTTLNINTNGFNSGAVTLSVGAVLNLNTGGVMNTVGLNVDAGTLNLNGGTVTNNVSTFSVSANLASRSVLNVNGGSLIDLNPSGLRLGNNYNPGGTNELNIYGGYVKVAGGLLVGQFNATRSFLTMTNGALYSTWTVSIAGGGGNGSLMLSGGLITNNAGLFIGYSGGFTGTVTQTGGTWVQQGTTTIAGPANSTGIFDFQGGNFYNTTNLTIGGTGVTGNAGRLTIGSGQFFVTNTAGTAVLNVYQGSLVMTGGVLDADQLLVTNGASSSFAASGGSLVASSAAIGSSFSLTNSTGIFSNLTITSFGALAGTNGVLAISRDLINQSTNRTQFDLSRSTVFFTNGMGTTVHILNLTNSLALDMGAVGMNAAQLATNFSIGRLSIALSNNMTLTGMKAGATTNALYVGWLDLSVWNTNAGSLNTTLSNALTLPDINLYYDASDTRNAYLRDASYALWGGGGLLIPIPEPSILLIVIFGLTLLAVVRRRGARGASGQIFRRPPL